MSTEKVRRNSSAPFLEEVVRQPSNAKKSHDLIVELDEEQLTEEDSVSGVSTTDIPTPPDGGWGWMVVFASFMIHIVGKIIKFKMFFKSS